VPCEYSLGENAKMALDTLREIRCGHFCCMGVVIGITALITVSSIPGGILQRRHDISARTMARIPSGFLRWLPAYKHWTPHSEERNRKPLSLEDGLAIREQCPAVAKVGISVSKRIYDYNRQTLITARYKGQGSLGWITRERSSRMKRS